MFCEATSFSSAANMLGCYRGTTKAALWQLWHTASFVCKTFAIATIVIGALSRLEEQSNTTGTYQAKKNNSSSVTHISAERVRVICLVVTYAGRHDGATVHVLRTWARHCTRVVFISDEEHSELEPLVFRREHPQRWALIKASFKHVYRRYLHEADWFLKVNDDNFVVLENLRYLLYAYAPDKPIYFGCKMMEDNKQPYMHASAGYVLSREALRRFIEVGLPNGTLCRKEDDGYEDVELGRCLTNVGVVAGDSRDQDGSSRFLPFAVRDHLNGLDVELHSWFYERSYYAVENGTALMSRNTICFSNSHPDQMYDLEYFIYKLRLYGLEHTVPTLASDVVGH